MRYPTLAFVLLLSLAAALPLATQPLAAQPPWVADPDLFEAPPGPAEPQAPDPDRPARLLEPANPPTLGGLATQEQTLDQLEAELQALEAELVRAQPPSVPAGAASAPEAGAPAGGREPWDRQSQEEQAYQAFLRTGRAPVLARPAAQLFPYGEAVPTLVCAPDRACDLALEAGEVIDGLALGAADQWEVTRFFEGVGDELVPHVIVKPHEFGVRTNVVVVTSRRTYHLELRSIEKEALGEPGDDEPAYHHQVAFWYPERWAQSLRSAEERAVVGEALEAGGADSTPEEAAPDPARLNFRYRLEPAGKKRRRLPWVPRAVYDDGTRIYIQLPPGTQPLPALVGLAPDGTPFPVNEHLVDGDTFVVPRLVRRLELTHGTGKARRFLEIHRLDSRGEAR